MVFTAPIRRVRVLADDPDDDKLIECALASGAKVIISGGNHILRLGSYRGIAMMTPADFLKSASRK